MSKIKFKGSAEFGRTEILIIAVAIIALALISTGHWQQAVDICTSILPSLGKGASH